MLPHKNSYYEYEKNNLVNTGLSAITELYYLHVIH